MIFMTQVRLEEIRENLNSVQRTFDPYPQCVQELFNEVMGLRAMLDAANAIIGGAADEAAWLTNRLELAFEGTETLRQACILPDAGACLCALCKSKWSAIMPEEHQSWCAAAPNRRVG